MAPIFNLKRGERVIVIFLVSTLLLGLGLTIYVKSRPAVKLDIKNFRDQLLTEETKISVNINDAGMEELMRLKGIGKVLAQRIIDYRAEKGPFGSVSDIKNVKGIGENLFEKIKDDITVE